MGPPLATPIDTLDPGSFGHPFFAELRSIEMSRRADAEETDALCRLDLFTVEGGCISDEPFCRAVLRCSSVGTAHVEHAVGPRAWTFTDDDPLLVRPLVRISCCDSDIRRHARELEHRIHVALGPRTRAEPLESRDDGTLDVVVHASLADGVCAYLDEERVSYYRAPPSHRRGPRPRLADFEDGYLIAARFLLEVPREHAETFRSCLAPRATP